MTHAESETAPYPGIVLFPISALVQCTLEYDRRGTLHLALSSPYSSLLTYIRIRVYSNKNARDSVLFVTAFRRILKFLRRKSNK